MHDVKDDVAMTSFCQKCVILNKMLLKLVESLIDVKLFNLFLFLNKHLTLLNLRHFMT